MGAGEVVGRVTVRMSPGSASSVTCRWGKGMMGWGGGNRESDDLNVPRICKLNTFQGGVRECLEGGGYGEGDALRPPTITSSSPRSRRCRCGEGKLGWNQGFGGGDDVRNVARNNHF